MPALRPASQAGPMRKPLHVLFLQNFFGSQARHYAPAWTPSQSHTRHFKHLLWLSGLSCPVLAMFLTTLFLFNFLSLPLLHQLSGLWCQTATYILTFSSGVILQKCQNTWKLVDNFSSPIGTQIRRNMRYLILLEIYPGVTVPKIIEIGWHLTKLLQ